jgi:hypothetical protein
MFKELLDGHQKIFAKERMKMASIIKKVFGVLKDLDI